MLDMEAIKNFSIDKSGWKKVQFGDVVFELKESVKDPISEGIEHVVGLEHITSEDIHLRRSAGIEESTTFTKKFSKGDVLFGRRRAYLKKAAQATFEGICSGDITVMRAKADLFLPELLPFLVNNDKFFDYAITHSAGGLSPRVKFKDLATFEFCLPSLEQQRELLSIFKNFEVYSESIVNQKLKLDILRKSLLQSLNNGLPGSQKVKIRDLMKFHYGSGLTEKDRIDGLYPVVSSAGVQGTHNEFLTEGPGVVVGRKGNVGQVTYIEDSFWTIDTAYYIEIKDKYKNLPLKFFSYLLESANLRKYSIATAVPGLNRDDALLTNVSLPGEDSVKDFILEIENVESCLIQIEVQKKNTQSLKNNIANKVF